MEKRRIGEDFKYVWSINWNGVPEDFSDTIEMVLTASVYGKRKELERDVDYVVDGNLLKIDFTPKICTISGIYNLELNYVKPSDGFIDGERRSAVDIDAFQIVPKTAQITATGGITGTSDAIIGFYGLSAYEVWLKDNPESTKEDYFNWLQKPATDAVSLIDDKIEHLDEVIGSSTENEEERVTAEIGRQTAEGLRGLSETDRETAEGLRISAETARINAEGDATKGRVKAENERVTAETSRKTAEGLRVDAEILRQSSESERNENEELRVESEIVREQQELERQANTATAISNANTATSQADIATGKANTARDEAVIATSDARDAISDMETATSDANVATGKANTATTQANTARDNANSSALNADEKAMLAETAAQNANNATSDFSDAEVIREQQEQARQANTATAITNAENAITDVNAAKDDYYDVVKPDIIAQGVYAQEQGDYAKAQGEAIQDDLALKVDQADLEETTEKPTAQSLSELNARITALEAILSNKIKDRVDVTKEFNVWGKTNLILYGDGASTKTPDFIGQTYIDTTNSNVYIAVGNSNAGNWKLV